MQDQAFQLRHLKRQTSQAESVGVERPYVVAMLGSKGGVGTTTVAASLAQVAGARLRTVVSCVEPRFDDLAAITGVGASWSIGEALLHASIPWREGVVLLPAQSGSAAGHRPNLLPRMANVEPGCQAVIVDCGSWDVSAGAQPLCEQSDAIVIATTSDNLAMMDTYACIKQLMGQQADVGGKLHVLINQVGDREAATEALARLQLTCQRFLGLELLSSSLVMLADFPPVPADSSQYRGPDTSELFEWILAGITKGQTSLAPTWG